MADLKISYEKDWDSACIHADLPCPYAEDYQLRMLKNNFIPHLAHVDGTGRDGTSRYTFRSDGGILIEEKFRSRDIRAKDVLTFTEQLLETAESLTEHMLNPDRILLSPELVFAEEENFRFCYLPAGRDYTDVTLGGSFHRMTEYFVEKLDYRETDGILLVYRLHKETMQENFDLKKILEEYKEESAECRKEEEESREESGRGLSEGTVFLPDNEEEEENADGGRYVTARKTMCVKEKNTAYGAIRKVMNRIKTGRWGEWEDLITEIDGQDRDGHL